MFERIVLAVDGASDAREATRYARELAVRDGAQVVVVTAFERIPTILGEPQQSEMEAERVAEARLIAEEAAHGLEKAGVGVIVEVLEGPAAEAILKVANVRQSDLIVMGSRGHGNLARLVLGSVSHSVLAKAHVPVLIARAQE
jgi:nucleotide-binding universal stress UspA family protein